MTRTLRNSAKSTLEFDVEGGETLTLTGFRLVVAGYTGRDHAAVEEHIRELAAIGVPAPDSVPAFFELAPTLATHRRELYVDGANTSGEVEPVLVRAAGRLYLGVGSDHTDRDIEREDIARAKAACVKPLSRRLIDIGTDIDWDAITLGSTVDGKCYQAGSLSVLRPPADVLALLDARGGEGDDLVMFCGTVPVRGGAFTAGEDWNVSLTLSDGRRITHCYHITVRTERSA